MSSRPIVIVEVAAFALLVALAAVWAGTQNPDLEPWTVVVGLVGGGIDLYRRLAPTWAAEGRTVAPPDDVAVLAATPPAPPAVACPGDVADLVDALKGVDWRPLGRFDFRWPDASESYDEGYEAQVEVGGRVVLLTIGFCNRASAGDGRRRRAVVFLGRRPRLAPLVEFSGENSEAFAATGRMASVVKLPSNKHLRPGEAVPPEYEGLPLAPYNQIVVGPYAAGSLAVVAHRGDLGRMAHHGLIRARWRGLA